MSKRILAILLSGLMAFSIMPTAFAEEAETNSEAETSVAEEVVEEETTPEPTTEPTIEPTDAPTVEPTVEPTATPTTEPSEESSMVEENEETITIEDSEAAVENNNSVIASDECGDDVTWTLDSEGTLTISGYGEMENYQGCVQPWNSDLVKCVVIEDGVTSIGSYAFGRCINLTSVTIPGSVTSISHFAFEDCRSLTGIDIPDSVISIDVAAFQNCSSLTSVTLPENITTIRYYTFGSCESLKIINIPNSVTAIEDYAFKNCSSLENVEIPDNVAHVGFCTFQNCNLTNVLLPINFETEKMFCDCSVKNIYYKGTKSQWNDIKEDVLENISGTPTIYYNATHIHDYSTTTTKATLNSNGKKTTKCSVCGDVKSSSTYYKIASVTIPKTSYIYGGYNSSPIAPTVTVKDSKGKTLKKNTDYTVTYSSGRKYPGTYKVTVKFKGNYSGTKELTFKIVPKGTSLSSVSASSKAFTAKWNLQKTQATGYQIEYSTSSKFSSGNVYKTITKNTNSSLKVSGLKAKTKYYVRVRTYKLVNGTKVCSAWSSTKSVITK